MHHARCKKTAYLSGKARRESEKHWHSDSREYETMTQVDKRRNKDQVHHCRLLLI